MSSQEAGLLPALIWTSILTERAYSLSISKLPKEHRRPPRYTAAHKFRDSGMFAGLVGRAF